MTVALILANDWGDGWADRSKYHSMIGQEKLIERTMRQIKTIPVVLVSHIRSVLELSAQTFDSWMPYSSCELLLSTEEIWRDDTIILPGDTVWPRHVLGKVLNDDSELMFYGNYCDVFAIRFNQSQHDKIKSALQRVIKGVEHSSNPGRLWHFYRAMIGQKNLNQHDWDYNIFTVLPSAGTPEQAFTQRLRSFGDYRRFMNEQSQFVTPEITEYLDNYERTQQVIGYLYGTAMSKTPG